MREKLLNLMKAEQLTASKLAELLGIQPSGISHILGGRNKPSFDLVQKILRRFPRINPDWLLLDSEQMYRPEVEESQTLLNQAKNITAETPVNSEKISGVQNTPLSESSAIPANIEQFAVNGTANRKNVKRVIVLFDDHTFESFELPR